MKPSTSTAMTGLLFTTLALGLIISISEVGGVEGHRPTMAHPSGLATTDEASDCPWTDRPWGDADCVRNRGLIAHIKSHLNSCTTSMQSNPRSISHRGAPAVIPEHTMAGYQLALSMGASFIECDVAVTRDGTLVCRHSMCDLATTTDILKGRHHDLAAKCSKPFQPATTAWPSQESQVAFRQPASVLCCTYDFTYVELLRLCMTMEQPVNLWATRPEDYTNGPPSWRINAFEEAGECQKIVRHRDMAAWLLESGANAIPELKDTAETGTVAFMESVGGSVTDLANQLMAELQEVGFTQTMVNGSNGEGWTDPEGPKAVMQTFDREIAKHWKSLPNALPVCYLYEDDDLCEPSNCGTDAAIQEMAAAGVEVIGPPLWGVVNSRGHTMGPTARAAVLREMAFGVTPWSLERSSCPSQAPGGKETPGPCGWYYTGLEGVSAFQYSDMLLMAYSLLHEVNAMGVFSDYPLLTTVMANCVPPAFSHARPSDDLGLARRLLPGLA